MDTMDTWHGCGLVVEVLRKQRICFIVHCPVLRGEGGMSLGAKKIFWTLQWAAACMKRKAPLWYLSDQDVELTRALLLSEWLLVRGNRKTPDAIQIRHVRIFFILAIADQSWGAGNIFNWGIHVGVGGYCFISRKVLDYFIELWKIQRVMFQNDPVSRCWEILRIRFCESGRFQTPAASHLCQI